MGRNSGNCFDTIQNFRLDSSSNKREKKWGEALCRYICARFVWQIIVGPTDITAAAACSV